MTATPRTHAPGRGGGAYCRRLRRPAIAASPEAVTCIHCHAKMAAGGPPPAWPNLWRRLGRRVRGL